MPVKIWQIVSDQWLSAGISGQRIGIRVEAIESAMRMVLIRKKYHEAILMDVQTMARHILNLQNEEAAKKQQKR